MRRPPSKCLVAIILLLSLPTGLLAADPPHIQLSRNGKALMPIVISEQASKETQKVAEEFAAYLGKLAGAEFAVESGNGATGIAIGQAGDFANLPFEFQFKAGPFDREDYELRSHTKGLCLIGATDLAVSHAVWDFLSRFGYRQYFPGPNWEIIPPPADLKIAINVAERPDFHARRIWYNWGLWGYNNEPYHQWCQRNRVTKGFRLNSGHAYGSILASNRKEFAAHPEYYALIDGERRTTGGDIKFCVSNAGLRKLVVAHAVAAVKKSPQLDSISMDPSDGGNWCQCEACAKMGGPSDRALTLANDVARAINQLDLGEKYVGMYAYNEHSPPPKIKADKHVIISATTAFIRGGYTFDQIVEGWQAQGATTGVYDYLSVIAWDWNLPRGGKGGRLATIESSLPKFHSQGARFYDAESGDCWGPCGLGYYFAGKVLWNIDEAANRDAIVEDFLDNAFGTAKEPMREFYHLINVDRSRRPPADIIGRMYRSLSEARSATKDPKVLSRIDDLILYTRYAELYFAHAAGKASKQDVAAFAYRIRKTMMVHSYGIWARLVGQKAAHTKEHPLKNETPVTAQEISKWLTEGIKNNKPVDPGFVGVDFSRQLVPASPLKLSSGTLGKWPASPQDRQRHFVWLNEGQDSLNIKIRVKKRWVNRQPELRLYSPKHVHPEPIVVNDDYQPDGVSRELKLPTQFTGLHRVETIDGGDYTYIDWPKGMPVTLESGIDTSGVTSHFRGEWSLYFYVPKGTKVVGGWASRIANWAPRISGKMLDGSGNEVFEFGKADEGWFKVAVPAGEDGKLWKFDRSQGQRLLMTVPPYLARSADELLLPAEIVKADAATE